jgi:MFS family permease
VSAELEAAAPSSIFRGRLRATSIGILILITLIAFEAMAVSAALPTAARDVHGLGGYGWAFTGFLVANVVGMVVSGQLSDSRGPRLPLTVGLVCFAGGLITSGTATTMTQLVGGRVIQGLGSGLLITAVYVVAGEQYPSALQPKLFAATSSAWVVPSLLGPVVSGVLAQHASWRWVFLGLVPFVLVGAALLAPVLKSLHVPAGAAGSAVADPRRILRALAVAAGIAALEGAGQHPSPASLVAAAAGVVALVWGLRALLPPGTIRIRPGVSAPIALRGVLAGVFFGVESVIPLSMTVQHGYGATAAGLPLAGCGLTWALGSWWQGRTGPADEQQRRVRLVRSGFAFVGLSALAVAVTAHPAAPGWLIYPAWGLSGLGAGLTMSSVSVLMLRYTNDADRGADSAALQLSDATSSAITTGLAGVLVAAAARGAIGYTTAFTVLDVSLAGLAVVGVLAASRVRPALTLDGPKVPAARPA